MRKSIYALLIIFSTTVVSSQNISLIKNTHPKARALDHNLNESRDSLILKSDITILQVEIFNEDYEKLISVEDDEVKISMADIPEGKFAVEAKLTDRIIVMDLTKYYRINDVSNATNEATGGIGMMLDEQLNIVKSSPTNSIEYILTRNKSNKKTPKKQNFYWTLSIINTGDSSSKTMQLASQHTVDKMISKHKAEIKTINASRNKLIIWEIFDKTKFLAQQFSNPDYINSSVSNLFDVSPFFTSESDFN